MGYININTTIFCCTFNFRYLLLLLFIYLFVNFIEVIVAPGAHDLSGSDILKVSLGRRGGRRTGFGAAAVSNGRLESGRCSNSNGLHKKEKNNK